MSEKGRLNEQAKRLLKADARKMLLFILAAAAVLRWIYVFSLEEKSSFFDTVHYDTAARSLLEGRGFGPSLHYYDRFGSYCLEPTYPLFMAGVYSVFGAHFWAVRFVQTLLSLLQIYLIYRITRLIRPQEALYAAAFAAVYPFFIYITGLLYGTQLFALLLTTAVYFLCRYAEDPRLRWAAAGFAAASAAVTVIPVIAPLLPLYGLWILHLHRRHIGRGLLHAAAAAAVTIAVLAPWTVRNYRVFGVLSPGRACLAETRVFEEVDTVLRYEDAFKQPLFDGRRFSVERSQHEGRPLFTYFLDDRRIGALKVVDPSWSWPDSAYWGLILYGGDAVQLPLPEFFTANGSFDAFAHFQASTQIHLHDGFVSLPPTPAKWDYKVVGTEPADVVHMRLTYPRPVSPHDMRRFALLIGLDAPSLTANGYMLWLHPHKDADLWRIVEGRPFKPVDVVDLKRLEQPMTLQRLIAKEPVRFFTRHFFPELVRFWLPWIGRIQTEENRPGMLHQAVSVLFFAPLLIFFWISVPTLLRSYRTKAWLLLLPIAMLNIGYAVFFVEVRYRIPIDAFLIVAAAVGFSTMASKLYRAKV